MGRLLSLAVTGAFTITLLIAGSAGAVVCDPHCAPPKANTGGETKGLNRANAVAGDHGQHGRCDAIPKCDGHRHGIRYYPTDCPGSAKCGGHHFMGGFAQK